MTMTNDPPVTFNDRRASAIAEPPPPPIAEPAVAIVEPPPPPLSDRVKQCQSEAASKARRAYVARLLEYVRDDGDISALSRAMLEGEVSTEQLEADVAAVKRMDELEASQPDIAALQATADAALETAVDFSGQSAGEIARRDKRMRLTSTGAGKTSVELNAIDRLKVEKLNREAQLDGACGAAHSALAKAKVSARELDALRKRFAVEAP